MRMLLIASACILALASPGLAADIAWISFHGADDMPTTAAMNLGFTEAPDVGYTDLLSSAGHTVTRIVGSATPDVALLNTFDLVMVSRSNNSGNFSVAASPLWSSVGVPMIHLGGYAIRGGTGGGARLGFTTGETIPDTTGPVNLTVNQPAHPIFAGVALSGGVMVDTYANLATMPVGSMTVQRGISVNTNSLPAGATLLASLPSIVTADPPGQVGMVIGEFPAGTTLSNAQAPVQHGHRLVFLTGSREHAATTDPPAPSSSEIAGIFDLASTTANNMLLNAVTYMVNKGPIVAGDANGNGVADINDYIIIRNNFNMTGKTRAQGDVNFDTVVDFADFRIWKNNRTAGAGAISDAELLAGLGGSAVPEPASVALMLLGALALLGAAARRKVR